MNIRGKGQNGFTLIELMITVAIVGILSALTIPAYLDYLVRSEVSEGIGLMDGFKTPTVEYYAQYGSFPVTNADMGLNIPSGKYSSMTMTAGTSSNGANASITLQTTYGNSANKNIQGKNLLLIGQANDGSSVTWTCTTSGANNPVDKKYLPTICQN